MFYTESDLIKIKCFMFLYHECQLKNFPCENDSFNIRSEFVLNSDRNSYCIFKQFSSHHNSNSEHKT